MIFTLCETIEKSPSFYLLKTIRFELKISFRLIFPIYKGREKNSPQVRTEY